MVQLVKCPYDQTTCLHAMCHIETQTHVSMININSFQVSFMLRTCFATNLFDWPITKKF